VGEWEEMVSIDHLKPHWRTSPVQSAQLPTRGQSPAGWMFFSSLTPRPCLCRGNVAEQVYELTLRKSPKLCGQNLQVYCASFIRQSFTSLILEYIS
jgi:hypothetical protein